MSHAVNTVWVRFAIDLGKRYVMSLSENRPFMHYGSSQIIQQRPAFVLCVSLHVESQRERDLQVALLLSEMCKYKIVLLNIHTCLSSMQHGDDKHIRCKVLC